jgi:hypothetical protein
VTAQPGLQDLVRENPFFVLELPTTCSPVEVERQAQKLLGMLELGLGEAKQYWTPWGSVERTPESVRSAAAALRDPKRRLLCELTSQLSRDPLDSSAAGSARVLRWTEAERLHTPWRRR